MRRRGSPRALARWRLSGGGLGRVCLLIAALVMAVGGASPAGAHPAAARADLVMVICADGVAQTVVLGRDGAPLAPSSDGSCAGLCLCCPATAAPGLPPAASEAALQRGAAEAVPHPANAPVLAFERGRLPVPRGPPFKDNA